MHDCIHTYIYIYIRTYMYRVALLGPAKMIAAAYLDAEIKQWVYYILYDSILYYAILYYNVQYYTITCCTLRRDKTMGWELMDVVFEDVLSEHDI